MKISLYTLVLDEYPLESVIRYAAELGYQGIEFLGRAPHLSSDLPPQALRQIRGWLDDFGLEPVGIATYTGGYSRMSDAECAAQLEELKRFVDAAAEIGCPLIRHAPGGPAPREASEAHWSRAAEWMARAADLAGEAGIRLAMEIHFGGLEESAESSKRLLDMVGRDNVGVIHDAGNMYIAGADYGEASVELLGERIFHVHVKDEERLGPSPRAEDTNDPSTFRVGDELYRHRMLGGGRVDHRPLLRALGHAGYTGFLSIECHGGGDRRAVAQHEIAALRDLLAETGNPIAGGRTR